MIEGVCNCSIVSKQDCRVHGRVHVGSAGFDPVQRPQHYASGGVECIDAMQAALSPSEFKGYLRGNAFKYIWRCEDKGNPEQDLAKAAWYLEKLRTQK